jgi:hypothetical protein
MLDYNKLDCYRDRNITDINGLPYCELDCHCEHKDYDRVGITRLYTSGSGWERAALHGCLLPDMVAELERILEKADKKLKKREIRRGEGRFQVLTQ